MRTLPVVPGRRRRTPSISWSAGVAAATLAIAVSANADPIAVWFWDDDPFVSNSARLVGAIPAGDWTSEPIGLMGPVTVVVERFRGAIGLGGPLPVTIGNAPAGTRTILANQLASDIAFFDFTGRPGPSVGPTPDLDADGLPDAWERRHFGASDVDPDADPDGDGFGNVAEFEAGSDPTDEGDRPPMPGLVGWWRGNGDARDAVGGHHGQWRGAAAFAGGPFREAFRLTEGAHVEVPADAVLRVDQALTIAAWVRVAAVDGNGAPLVVLPSTHPGLPALALVLGPQGPRFQISSAAYTATEGPILTPSTGVWYHLAVVWEARILRFYFNGRLAWAGRADVHGPLDYASDGALLLGHDGATRRLEGDLDEVVLAREAWTDDQVRWLAGGSGGPRRPVPDDALLVEGEDQTVWWLEGDGTRPRFVTHGRGARMTPDRQKLVFRRGPQSPTDGPLDSVVVRDLVHGTERSAFTVPSELGAVSLDVALSGDGVVLSGERSQAIAIYPFNEDPPVVLADGRALGFTPTQVSVCRTDGRLAWYAFEDGRPWTADADGRNAAPLPAAFERDPLLRFRFPSWAPDGAALAFRRGRGVAVVRGVSSAAWLLTEDQADAVDGILQDSAPAWTPDGTEVAVVVSSPGVGKDRHLVFLAADGSGPRRSMVLPGPPVVSVVHAGLVSGSLPPRLEVEWTPPDTVGGAPRLRFPLPPQRSVPSLEAVGDLGRDWEEAPAVLREVAGRRVLEIPVESGRRARFFRLRW